MFADELAACFRAGPVNSALPNAYDLLRGSSPSCTSLCDSTALLPPQPMSAAPSPLLSPAASVTPEYACPLPSASVPSTPERITHDLAGSRLARRWLRGIAARDALGGDEAEATPSMLDLTQLCCTAPDEPSPTSIVPSPIREDVCKGSFTFVASPSAEPCAESPSLR